MHTYFQTLLMMGGAVILCTVVTVETQPTVTGEPWVDINQATTLTCTPSGTIREVSWRKYSLDEQSCINQPPCIAIVRFIVSTSQIIWGTSVDPNRYLFNGAQSDYPLTIQSVTLADEGTYDCLTNAAGTGDQSNSTAMRVRVPPSTIALSYDGTSYSDGNTFPIVAGSNRQFTCTTPGVKPAANFTWTLPTSITTDQPLGSQRNTTNSSDSRLTDSTNTITVAIAETPATAQLTCGASNRQDGSNIADMSVTVTLQVRVPPTDVKLSNASGDLAPGEVISVTEGISNPITCMAQGTRPAATIQWFMDNVTPSTGVGTPTVSPSNGLIDTTGTWTFTPVRANHRQVVKCVANTLESQQPYPSAEITLNVYGPPDNPMITSSTPMMEGAETRLVCTADKGYPNNWQLKWSNGTMEIDSTTTTYQDSSSFANRYMFTSNLDITPSREDNGKTIIHCAAERGPWIPGREGSYGPIDVQFCARTVSAQCPVVTAGNPGTLSCASESSNPETNLTWYDKNDMELTSETPQVDPNGAYGGEVTTRRYTTAELNKTNNGEEFKCCATNTAITCASNLCDMCTLDVRYPPEFAQPTKAPSNPVVEGGNVTLTCKVDANPRPSDITWKKQDSSEAFSSVYDDVTSTLTLSNIRREQAGYYMCRANNGVPTDDPNDDVVSEPVTVIVHYEVNITNKAMNEVGVKNGDNAVLTCIAVGNPQPVMEWYGPNNTMITNDTDEGKFLITNETSGGDRVFEFEVTSKLTIKAVDSRIDYGVYTCICLNDIGREDLLNITLNGTRRPDKPTRVEITKQTAESLNVTWTPGYDGGEEQSFRVSCIKTSDSTEVFTEETGGKTTSIATGLNGYTEYEIRVYAKNAIGESIGYGNTMGYTLPKAPDSSSGITVGFNKKDGTVAVGGLKEGIECIQLEVQYEGDDTWQKCGVCITSDQTVTLPDHCASSQRRRRRAVGDIEAVRSKLCIGGLCSQPADAKEVIVTTPDPTSSEPNVALIVGASVGGVALVAIIVVLVVYLVRTSPKKRSGKEDSSSGANDIQEVELQEPSHDVQPEENNGITNEALLNNEGDDGYMTMENKRKLAYPVPPKRETSLPQKTVEDEIVKSAARKTAGDEPTNKVQDEMVKSSPPKTAGDEATNKVQEKPKSISEKPAPSAESATEATNTLANRGDSKPPVTRPKPKAVKKYQAPSKTEVDEEIPKKKPEKNEEPDAEPTEEDGLEADTTKGPIPVKRYTVDSGDTYAQVNKTKLPPKPQSARSAPTNLPDVTYAEVNKDKKPKPPHDDYAAKKKPKKYVPPSSRAAEESAYEEVQISDKDKAKGPPAADSADTYASVGAQQDTSGRVVTEDGLIYAEVGHMKQHPVDQPPIQTEESTEYASLDFARMKPEDK